jgi:type III secretory pathway component EscU
MQGVTLTVVLSPLEEIVILLTPLLLLVLVEVRVRQTLQPMYQAVRLLVMVVAQAVLARVEQALRTVQVVVVLRGIAEMGVTVEAPP